MRRGIAGLQVVSLACFFSAGVVAGVCWELASAPRAPVLIELAPINTSPRLPRASSALELRGGCLCVPRGWRLDLTRATLTDVTIMGNLCDADLSQAKLWECDLRQADLTGADLRGTYYDPLTRWPVGFISTGRGDEPTPTE